MKELLRYGANLDHELILNLHNHKEEVSLIEDYLIISVHAMNGTRYKRILGQEKQIIAQISWPRCVDNPENFSSQNHPRTDYG